MIGMRHFWKVTFSVFSHYPLFGTLPIWIEQNEDVGGDESNNESSATVLQMKQEDLKWQCRHQSTQAGSRPRKDY